MTMKKITHEELESFNQLIQKEQEILNRIISSNKDISKTFYNPEKRLMIIQFQSGKPIHSDYLNSLKELMDYKSYSIVITSVTEKIFKISYTEQILQLNIYL